MCSAHRKTGKLPHPVWGALLLRAAAVGMGCGGGPELNSDGETPVDVQQHLYTPLGDETRPFVGTFRSPTNTEWCTASLITPNSVLTARHCVPGPVSFQIGGVTYPLGAIQKHPVADVAVVTLASPVTTIQPACLDTVPAVVGEDIIVEGCGQPTHDACKFAYTKIAALRPNYTNYESTSDYIVFETMTYYPVPERPMLGHGDSGGAITRKTNPMGVLGINSQKVLAETPFPLDAGLCNLGDGSTQCSADVAVANYVDWIKSQAVGTVCTQAQAYDFETWRAGWTTAQRCNDPGWVAAHRAVPHSGAYSLRLRSSTFQAGCVSPMVRAEAPRVPATPGKTFTLGGFARHGASTVSACVVAYNLEQVQVGGVCKVLPPDSMAYQMIPLVQLLTPPETATVAVRLKLLSPTSVADFDDLALTWEP